MNIQQFLSHHGIVRNPFAEEDAQIDPVFKDHCIDSAFHPVWDKVYGDPREPSTSIVFGPKGAGKTAMRLQVQRKVELYNRDNPSRRLFVVRYDDFNPFLGQFQQRLTKRQSRSADKILAAWQLWDHMDAILSLAVTDLVNQVVDANSAKEGSLTNDDVQRINDSESRDLLLLAMTYDHSTSGVTVDRWKRLKKTLNYQRWFIGWDCLLAWVWGISMIILVISLKRSDHISLLTAAWLLPLLVVVGNMPYIWRWLRCQWLAMGIRRHMRVGNRETGTLRKLLMRIPPRELASQPLPRHNRTDDRYASLAKLQGILRTLRYDGMLVLLDRVDEPEAIEGRIERMKSFVWPLLDNKLLKHTGIGFKMMLPRELYRETEREDRSFHERARLDKQNVISDFNWTGQALYDVMSSRISACAAPDRKPSPADLFDSNISRDRLMSVFESLRVPRHLFRCLYRMLVEHCNQHTDMDAKFQLKSETVEKVLAVYQRDIESSI